MSEEGTGGQGRTFTPTQWVLSLGGLAAAILSIIAVVQLVLPEDPATAGGEITDVFIDSSGESVTVNFEATIEGYSGQRCEVRWTLFDNNSRAVVPEADFQDEHGTYITPSRNRDEVADEFQVRYTGEPGYYFVKLMLLRPEESGQKAMDEVTSEVFEHRVYSSPAYSSPANQQYSSPANQQYSSGSADTY